MMNQEPRTRGLQAIAQTKHARKFRKIPVIPGRAFLWLGLILLVWGVLYYRKTQAQLESGKAKLFERQRSIAAQIGPSFEPVRNRIEAWTASASGAYEGDWTDPDLAKVDFRSAPGVYLRLRLSDATKAEDIRKAADHSLRDGFTSCLVRVPNPDPTSGPACRYSRDCEAGLFCNEFERCTKASQPYNMRAIYRGTRVLDEEWTVDLRTTTNDMRLRLLEHELDAVASEDVPLAVDALSRASFFLLVLDEDPAGEVEADAGAEAIQAMPHAARVFLWDLKKPSDKPLLRLRREVDAKLYATGSGAASPESLAAQKRQANGCQLALEVRKAVGE